MHRLCEPTLTFQNAFAAREIGLENLLLNQEHLSSIQLLKKHLQYKNFSPNDFLDSIESYVPHELISQENYSEIQHVAQFFEKNITSFFGFESKLENTRSRSDYMLAISSKLGEREALLEYLSDNNLTKKVINKKEWINLINFIESWTNIQSNIYDKILGIWFEFDIAEPTDEIPLPNIFLHTISIKNNISKEKIHWLEEDSLSVLFGQKLSPKLEKQLYFCIKKLPKNASLFNIGIMLSRPNSGIRLVIKRLEPEDIVPYLVSIGWRYETNELSQLINELTKYSDRIVISYDVLETGIGPKIGIECGFYPKNHDEYSSEPRWKDLLDYLVKNNLCMPEKCNALLEFICQNETPTSISNNENTSLVISAKSQNEKNISILARQIGHIKLVYKSNQPLEAKAYYGARLFSPENNQNASILQ